jgi:predicted outer membrane repeat protein
MPTHPSRIATTSVWTRATVALSSCALALACGAGNDGAAGTNSGDGDGGAGSGDASGSSGDGAAADGAGPGNDAARPPDVDAGSIPPPPATCTPPIAAVDTSNPTAVVGTGTAASCTEAALASALTAGGIVTFACGAAPATITVTKTISLPTDKDTVIDGGGKVTIDGGGKVRILDYAHADFRKNTHVLTLQHVTFAHGHATGTDPYAAAPAPCSSGFYDGAGGALQMRDGVLHVIDATFSNNQAESVGPDIGGGAIYLSGALGGVVVGSTFASNSGANGGAIGALNADLDVYNTHFEGNAALGFGANGDDATKCSVVAKTGQHQTGSGGNGGAICIDGGSDGTHTFCGLTLKGNKGGLQALGAALFRTPDGAKQTTVIDRCLFDGNTGDGGGAAYLHNSTLTITASTFSANTSAGTGAIQADGTTFDFTNVTFSGNHSTAGVGATLALFGGDGKLLNCTFANNVCDAANMFAAAIFGSPNLTFQNTIFDANTAQNAGAPMQCQVGTIAGTGNMQWPKNHVNGGGADALCAPGIYEDADPALGPLGDHGGPVPTLLPGAASPALGRGTGCPATDARGKARTAGACTAGAVEGAQ